jgi:2-phospho-L-lactate guanylyltransferase
MVAPEDCGGGVAGLSGDLPALRPGDLAAALRCAGRFRRSYVIDAQGTGTTVYSARHRADFAPRFGPDSASSHQRDAVALDLDVPSLRRDVDTIEDLWMAIRLGVGPRTAALRPLLPARSA